MVRLRIHEELMEIRRFFALPEDIAGDKIYISGEEFSHMKVLRQKVGYRVVVCTGDGKDYEGTVSEIKADQAVIKIDDVKDNENDPAFDITLFQALPKGDKMSLIVQKCTELGARKIIPFLSEFTEETKFNLERMQRVAKEACKQCGRSLICEVGELCSFSDVPDMLKDYDCVIMPYENATTGNIGEVKGLDKARRIAVIIGSEGGFSEKEVDLAKKSGAEIVSLGKRILRCETAGLVTIALIAYEKGELGR